MVKVAINGFGRIGRLVFRYAWDDPTLEIVHVNDLCSIDSAAYLVKYDSVHGTWDKDVKQADNDDSHFLVDDKKVTFSQHKDFKNIDFRGMGVEMVLECTGKFLKMDVLNPYIEQCGVKRVVVSAPVKEPTCENIVLGCNHAKLGKGEKKIVTNASCTTNCLAPVVKVIKESFGIKHGCITTIHDVTGTQVRLSKLKSVTIGLELHGMNHPCMLLSLPIYTPILTFSSLAFLNG
jgi:glyceraldehyde 3-phosphate dehydrogenase